MWWGGSGWRRVGSPSRTAFRRDYGRRELVYQGISAVVAQAERQRVEADEDYDFLIPALAGVAGAFLLA